MNRLTGRGRFPLQAATPDFRLKARPYSAVSAIRSTNQSPRGHPESPGLRLGQLRDAVGSMGVDSCTNLPPTARRAPEGRRRSKAEQFSTGPRAQRGGRGRGGLRTRTPETGHYASVCTPRLHAETLGISRVQSPALLRDPSGSPNPSRRPATPPQPSGEVGSPSLSAPGRAGAPARPAGRSRRIPSPSSRP